MTTPPKVRLRTERLIPLLSILVALGMTGTACGSANTPSAMESPASTATPGGASGTQADGPQYGASLEEYFDATGGDPEAASVPAESTEFQEIQWEDLIPPGSSAAEISARFADQLAAVEPGSHEAGAIYDQMLAEYDGDAVNAELDSMSIRLAGFVAPLTFDGETITEFLLVPYLGACIHVPAPPPNQTVLVTLDEGEGLTFDDSWGAVWVTGTLAVTSTETDMATANYSIAGARYVVHDGY